MNVVSKIRKIHETNTGEPERLSLREIKLSTEKELAGTESVAKAFVEALGDSSVMANVGVTVISGLKGTPAVFPRQTTHQQASFKTDAAATGDADIAFDNISVDVKHASSGQIVSREVTLQSASLVPFESIINREIQYQIGQIVDYAALRGTGTGNEPEGVIAGGAQKVVVVAPGAGGANALNWSKLCDIVEKVESENVLFSQMAWIMSSARLKELRTIRKEAGSGRYLLEEGNTLLGYPVFQNNAVGNTIYFGDWSKVYLLIWGDGARITADTLTGSARGATAWRVWFDFATKLVQPKAICYTDVS